MKNNIIQVLSGKETKEIKIKVLIKYLKNPKVRTEVLENIESFTKWANEKEYVYELIKALMKYKDSTPVIEEKWKSIIKNTKNGLGLVGLLGKNQKIKKEIIEELNLILENKNVSNQEIKEILKEIKNIPKGEEEIINQLPKLLDNPKRNLVDALYVLRENKKANEYMLNHLEEIIKWSKKYEYDQEARILYLILKKADLNPRKFEKNIPTIRKIYKEVLENANNINWVPKIVEQTKNKKGMKDIYKKNQYIIENFYETIPLKQKSKNYRNDIELYNKTIGTIIKEGQQEKIKAIVEEISQGKQVKPKYEGNGTFSMSYRINDKRLKIGYEKENYQIPYHPRIMYPIFRQNFKSKDQKRNLYIEVYEEGENNQDKITDEELARNLFRIKRSWNFLGRCL